MVSSYGLGHVRYLSISVRTISVPKSTCLVPRDHFGTCQVRYMGMSSSVPVVFGTKTSSVPMRATSVSVVYRRPNLLQCMIASSVHTYDSRQTSVNTATDRHNAASMKRPSKSHAEFRD